MSAQKINNEIDSVSYSLGVNIGENIKTQFPDIDLKNFEAAIKDVLDDSKEPSISGADAQKTIQEYFTKQQAKASESVVEEGRKFLAENSNKENVVTLESGLQYEVIKTGEGAKPTLNDQVTTIEFVIRVLKHIFNKEHKHALKLTRKIHEEGYGVVGSYIYEIAGQKELETSLMARDENFPLRVVIKIK